MRNFVSAVLLAAIVAYPFAADAGKKKGEKKEGRDQHLAATRHIGDGFARQGMCREDGGGGPGDEFSPRWVCVGAVRC